MPTCTSSNVNKGSYMAYVDWSVYGGRVTGVGDEEQKAERVSGWHFHASGAQRNEIHR